MYGGLGTIALGVQDMASSEFELFFQISTLQALCMGLLLHVYGSC